MERTKDRGSTYSRAFFPYISLSTTCRFTPQHCPRVSPGPHRQAVIIHVLLYPRAEQPLYFVLGCPVTHLGILLWRRHQESSVEPTYFHYVSKQSRPCLFLFLFFKKTKSNLYTTRGLRQEAVPSTTDTRYYKVAGGGWMLLKTVG